MVIGFQKRKSSKHTGEEKQPRGHFKGRRREGLGKISSWGHESAELRVRVR